MTQKITIFKNIQETDTPFYIKLGTALSRIKEGKSKDLVKAIREESDKKKRNENKKETTRNMFFGKI